MTTIACAKRGFCPENPSARLWKAVAFAGGLVLGHYSGPLHAAPSSGGDAVQGLHDALLSTMKSGKALGAISEVATRRSEFAAILKTEGIDGLISAPIRKAEILAMSGRQNLLGFRASHTLQ
jgi:hypothetical protein